MRRLASSQRHRGPDGEGVLEEAQLLLGMRRLAIIDLEGGWQPLHNEDQSISIVANGEIYNFIELRAELEARGHRFRTHSDCETIVHLYEELGDRCVKRLRGMFAFALYDRTRQRVLLARDRIGEKPLSIVRTPDSVTFCSESTGLVEAGIVPFRLDWHAAKLYMHYGFVPEPMSSVVGIEKLPPGHTLTVDLRSWKVSMDRYWSMGDAPPIEGDPVQEVHAQLLEIGRLIIRSDVPVGVALSGGLDSSAVACLAAKESPSAIQAFTIGYDGSPWQDEREMARELTRHLGIVHHTLELRPEDITQSFPEVCYRRDDPIADMSGPSYLAIMRLAREKGVPVMLLGQGGDELFWGYPWVRACVGHSLRKRAALEGRASLFSYLSLSAPPPSYVAGMRWLRDGGGLISGVRRWRRDRATAAEQLVFYDESGNYQEARHRFPLVTTERFHEATAATDPDAIFRGKHLWERPDISITRLLAETYLIGNGITQADRLSMATSVEGRLPFVDYRLFETVIGLRKARPDHMLAPKAWFRGALQGIVPEFVMKRRKRGFTPPWRVWLRAMLDAYGPQLVDGHLVREGVITADTARKLCRGTTRLGTPLRLSFELLVLEMWCRGMLASSPGSPRS